MGDNRPRIERKTMPVQGGVAWTEKITYRKRIPHRTKYQEMGADGKLFTRRHVHFMKGSQTGDCPECKQMPCEHTAKLLGWRT
jgi:hypothetical protein